MIHGRVATDESGASAIPHFRGRMVQGDPFTYTRVTRQGFYTLWRHVINSVPPSQRHVSFAEMDFVSGMKQAPVVQQKFQERFGTGCTLYRAPGRINLIGEHTDYNEGLVLPAAVGFYCWAAIGPRDDRKLVIHSEQFAQSAELDLDQPAAKPSGNWSDYPLGVVLQLVEAGYRLRGANLLIDSDVPLGAGLSSSAAIEVSVAYALAEGAGESVDRMQLARLCQRAENEFVGARSGIMDQFASLNGRAGHALMLDCRSLEYRLAPLPRTVELIACNTMVKHGHAGGEYNLRRAETEEGVRRLAAALPGIHSLRDVTGPQLEEYGRLLPAKIFRRCQHVITENERVLQTACALEKGDLAAVGRLMAESHCSLRDHYEVSSAELDLMVELAWEQEGVCGARMMGGGFGGCTINVVRAEAVENFRKRMTAGYEHSRGIRPEIYLCSASDGAERWQGPGT